MFRLTLCGSVLGLLAVFATASPNGPVPHLPGVRLATPPKIDGVLTAGEWPEGAHGQDFFDKDTFVPSPDKGEFWIGYDDKFIYFAGRAATDPRKLVADEYRQNVDLSGNDVFMLAVDANSSGQDIDLFRMNPQGATNLRLAGGRAAKTEWLGEFDCVGKITPDGWQVEARIPWALVARPAAGKHDLTFNVLWYQARQTNTYEWTITKDDFRNFPKWTEVDIPEVRKDRSIKLLPYAYAGVDEHGNHITNAGLDVKSEVGGLTVVGTANPDFRNIENNILNLDHSYFERLADDARPFFQEGSRYRSFGFDQKIFASQRITDFDFGVNAYGRVGPKTQMAVLSTFDIGNQMAFAGSIGHRFDDSRTLNFGFAHKGERGLENDAVHMFYDQRVGDWDAYVGFQGTNDQVTKTGSRINAGIFRENGGFSGGIEYVQVTPGFNPALGFSPEQDLRGVNGSLGIQRQPKGGAVREYSYSLSGADYWHMDGRAYRREINLENQYLLRNDLGVGWGATASRFEDSDDHLVSFATQYPVSNTYRNAKATFAWGRFQGTPYKQAGLQVNYRPVKRAQVALRTQFVEFGGFQRQLILSANYDVGRFEALGGRLVRTGDDWNWYLSYRMSGKRGNEFFLILGDPNATEFRKTLILKAVLPVNL